MGVRQDEIVERVREMAGQTAADLGLEIVDVLLRLQGKHTLLRIDVDRAGPRGVGLADCEALSRALDERLDDADVLRGAYELQVSSPGIDRPIVTDDDVRRNTGRRVDVELSEPIAGARRVRGVLLGLDGDALKVASADGGETLVPRGAIMRAVQDVEADLKAMERGRGVI